MCIALHLIYMYTPAIFSCCIQCYVAKCIHGFQTLNIHNIWCVHHSWLILSDVIHTVHTYEIMYVPLPMYVGSNETVKECWLYDCDDFDHQGLHQLCKVWYEVFSGWNILPQPFSHSLLSGVLKLNLLPWRGSWTTTLCCWWLTAIRAYR